MGPVFWQLLTPRHDRLNDEDSKRGNRPKPGGLYGLSEAGALATRPRPREALAPSRRTDTAAPTTRPRAGGPWTPFEEAGAFVWFSLSAVVEPVEVDEFGVGALLCLSFKAVAESSAAKEQEFEVGCGAFVTGGEQVA